MLSFDPGQVINRLLAWPPAARYHVAFSGGMDSSVLIEILASRARDLPGGLTAIHVDHGLHPQSAEWARHCAEVCRRLGIPLVLERVDAKAPAGESPEAWARKVRYGVFHRYVGPREMLLTAHHRDDQAETVLLQLVRGSGPAGLAGMPPLRPFGGGWHGRPLLEFSRPNLHDWGRLLRIACVDDESNADLRFDRNYLRNEILPRLEARWPGVPEVLQRTAELQAQAAKILVAVATEDMKSCAAGDALVVASLRRLDPERRANVVREWLRRAGLPMPGAAHIRRLDDEVIGAGADRNPCLRWPGAELRRYRGRLYASPPPEDRDPRERIAWRLDQPLALKHGLLTADRAGEGGLRADCCATGEVEVRFRAGGERLTPAGSRHRRELRTLFQEQGVPPWRRDRIPLVYVDGRLAAVPGLWVESEFAGGAVAGWEFHWVESPAAGVAES